VKHLLKLIFVVALVVSVVGVSLPANAQATAVSVWFHSGQGAERDALTKILDAYNASQTTYKAEAIQLPEGDFNNQVNAAAVAGNLPCLLDFDGPNVYNYAWAGYLIPLDDYVAKAAGLKDDLLPSIVDQGTYQGKLWSIGTFDSGLAIWGNRELLEKAGVRIPTSVDDAWTLDEFNKALEALKAVVPADGYPLDLKMNYGAGEWFTYGFSPIVQSFGGDLIDRQEFKQSDGVINGEAAVKAMTFFQGLFTNGYTSATPKDDNVFAEGKAALSYVGHWVFPQYSQALGDKLVLLPMPKFGEKAVTGTGSWNWGITASCQVKDGAWDLLTYLLKADNVKAFADASGAVPALKSVLAADDRYQPGGVLHIYNLQLSGGVGLPRPQTPAYPVITKAFATAVDEIAKGGEVQAALDKAADTIDKDIEDNNGYAPKN
jgi:multiple sugar transport system substrate-binding protein